MYSSAKSPASEQQRKSRKQDDPVPDSANNADTETEVDVEVSDQEMAYETVTNRLNSKAANPLVTAVSTPKERRTLQKAKAALEKRVTIPVLTLNNNQQKNTPDPLAKPKAPPLIVVTGKLKDSHRSKKTYYPSSGQALRLTSMTGKFKIQTQETADHRQMLQALDAKQVPCYTFQEKGQKT